MTGFTFALKLNRERGNDDDLAFAVFALA